MDVIKGYVAIGAIAGGAYVFYNWDKLKPKATAAVEATTSSASSRDVSTSKTQAKKRKPVKQAAPQAKAASLTTPSAPAPASRDEDDVEAVPDNDKEWARQLQARKTGVSISGPAAPKAAPSKKQNKTKQSGSGQSSSTASELDATSSGTAGLTAPIAGGVSDMLDAPAPAASVLRITGEEKAKKQQTAKEVQSQETKKQRQNRRKVEEQKAQRDADERERQILLENQRRTAREARGEPARNGLASAAVPASNAWSAPQSNVNTSTQETSQPISLLDTFEPETKPITSTTSGPRSAKQTAPTEDPQMQGLNELDGASGWNEVPKGKKAKGKSATQISSSSSTADLTSGNTSAVQAAVPKKTQPKVQPINNATAPKRTAQTNGYAALEAATTYSSTAKGHPDDSDWAVV